MNNKELLDLYRIYCKMTDEPIDNNLEKYFREFIYINKNNSIEESVEKIDTYTSSQSEREAALARLRT